MLQNSFVLTNMTLCKILNYTSCFHILKKGALSINDKPRFGHFSTSFKNDNVEKVGAVLLEDQ